MIELEDSHRPIQAYTVGIQADSTSLSEANEHLKELLRLLDTMGAADVGHQVAKAANPNPKLYLGSGKSAEILEEAKNVEAEILVFDTELSPTHQRNWEKYAGIPVLDRQQVIIEIFSQRAQTKEARLQVELAQLEYNLPRLTRAWTHLSRQRGGARGNRGKGETQLEMDRRMTERRITRIKEELQKVKKQRATLRKGRESVPVPTAALVGYTNAGKSSLLRALTLAEVFIEDKLFATLDPTTRRYDLGGGNSILLTDTVGFIRKLPHGLIDAFQATLEETLRSDILIHLVDSSDPEVLDQLKITQEVLQEIGAHDIPRVIVFNKIDLAEASTLEWLEARFPEALFMSTLTREGLEDLGTKLVSFLDSLMIKVSLFLPPSREDLAALCHRQGSIQEKVYENDGIRVQARIPARFRAALAEFEVHVVEPRGTSVV
ncbi:MAG: GTPase HflX [Spirochaetales bacterium]|nr:GTPase HflX [Spirochaetales bacterium]